ncbi:MAG TPA: bifunctional acetate--CoA ligase family protein/GNAT family N-acetyltransferase [Candidatus Bipolaricaulis anaerobius]|nr:bifunctional acetate--CoA ligase family protein/GNAT family N-acetyltransferase [Candidatus Bipolaricaulis anaerobius]
MEVLPVSIRNLDKIFNPHRVAVIGASSNPGTVGYSVLRNMINASFNGVVYPVNPKRESVQGIQSYPDVASLPRTPDLAVICTPATTVPGLVRDCGAQGIRGLVILSAGFRETGAEGKALEGEVKAAAAEFEGMRIIGPNCLGIIVPRIGMNATFAAGHPADGNVAFVSQSGALCTSILDWAVEEGIGFSYFVSVGNMLDVDFGDLIDYFGEDEHTRSILLYIESVTEARKFMSASRAFARSKPILVYKAGRFAESAKAASSHTGAMAGEDAVYDAAFRRAGMVRVYEIGDLFDSAELLARIRPPSGSRLAILTNAGGPGVMATDALIARRGTLAPLAAETLAKLNEILPRFWSHGNPVDVLGDAPPERYAAALEILLADPNVDAVIAILAPQAVTDPTTTAREVSAIATKSPKPVLAAWMGGRLMREGVELFNRAGVPTYATPDQAVEAFMHLVDYARNLELLYETPREIPVRFPLDQATIRTQVAPLLRKAEILSEADSKEVLAAYGIPVVQPLIAGTADEAVAAAKKAGYPVVLKILSPDITHKTDVGGVAVGLHSDDEVRATFARMLDEVRARRPEARLEGVTVQRMIDTSRGFELLVGAKKDPTFGAVLMMGMGGIAAEVYKDTTLALPPLNERLTRRRLESLQSWPLIEGYRGRPGADIDLLVETVMRVSYLVADYPEIKELDINPLVASPDEVVAVDARIVVDQEALKNPPRPYSHLAIRPYPEGYTRQATLRNGTKVLLRPIRPEDEPLWHEMLAVSSRESIRFRFRYLFKESTHQMAIPFCFIDYDREMAIVAEIEDGGRKRIVGVGRLVVGPDPTTAEYAVFVADPWQNQGLGGVLTDYCLEIARNWGVQVVTAETTPDNVRMIAIFQHRGFKIEHRTQDGVVLAQLLQGSPSP